MTEYIALSYSDLVLASLFLWLNGLISVLIGLGIGKNLVFSALRMTVQLLFVGMLLKFVIGLSSPLVTILIALIMVGFAGREIWARQAQRLTGWWGPGIGSSAMMMAGLIVTFCALTVQIAPDPWWSPRYALPLFGMILGNTMTGVSLALDRLHDTVRRERVAMEAGLLLGMTRWQALLPFLRLALVSGFMPIINAMAASGVVSLPGMMTGQILSGVDPQEAVKYQLFIMFLIGGATGLGVIAAVFMSALRLTDSRSRLRLDRLTKA